MAAPGFLTGISPVLTLPPLLQDIPILYEDEEEGDMGESNPHVDADEILHVGLKVFLRKRGTYRDMNLYYKDGPRHPITGSLPYVSPDVMVVEPFQDMGEQVTSYTVGRDGPAPLLTSEILSKRSGQQQDLEKKPIVYAALGIREYILVDASGRFLPERLQLRRLQPDRTWSVEQDPDGGVTSQLGFRLIWDTDGRLRLLDAATGERIARPDEAQDEAEARRHAEERLLLEAEARRLAEEGLQSEAQARRRAEEQLQSELEARRTAEERIRILEAELARRHEDPRP